MASAQTLVSSSTVQTAVVSADIQANQGGFLMTGGMLMLCWFIIDSSTFSLMMGGIGVASVIYGLLLMLRIA